MAVIKCPECCQDAGAQDQYCPNCGFPLAADRNCAHGPNTCQVMGRVYDFTGVLRLIQGKQTIQAIKEARELTGLGLADAKKLVDQIAALGRVPAQLSVSAGEWPTPKTVRTQAPRCPSCGSANIGPADEESGEGAGSLFHFFRKKKKSQFFCNSCRHQW